MTASIPLAVFFNRADSHYGMIMRPGRTSSPHIFQSRFPREHGAALHVDRVSFCNSQKTTGDDAYHLVTGDDPARTDRLLYLSFSHHGFMMT